jgi:hypothetical protein
LNPALDRMIGMMIAIKGAVDVSTNRLTLSQHHMPGCCSIKRRQWLPSNIWKDLSRKREVRVMEYILFKSNERDETNQMRNRRGKKEDRDARHIKIDEVINSIATSREKSCNFIYLCIYSLLCLQQVADLIIGTLSHVAESPPLVCYYSWPSTCVLFKLLLLLLPSPNIE